LACRRRNRRDQPKGARGNKPDDGAEDQETPLESLQHWASKNLTPEQCARLDELVNHLLEHHSAQQQAQVADEPSPPPFSGRPRVGGGEYPNTSASRPNDRTEPAKSPAADAMRVNGFDPAHLAYNNGMPANGVIGGIRYEHGLPCKHGADTRSAAESEDFASRFPSVARVRVV